VSILGFWAFGTAVSENVLLAFSQGPQHWVVAMANMMVVVHVAAAYQVGDTLKCIQVLHSYSSAHRCGSSIRHAAGFLAHMWPPLSVENQTHRRLQAALSHYTHTFSYWQGSA
jgi:hypothetical protein